MKTLVVQVRPQDAWQQTKKEFSAAMNGDKVAVPFSISFPSIESLAKTMLTANRIAIINAMTRAGAMSVRELARRLQRDVRGVHRDVGALLNAGVLDHDDSGKIVFLFDAVAFD